MFVHNTGSSWRVNGPNCNNLKEGLIMKEYYTLGLMTGRQYDSWPQVLGVIRQLFSRFRVTCWRPFENALLGASSFVVAGDAVLEVFWCTEKEG